MVHTFDLSVWDNVTKQYVVKITIKEDNDEAEEI